MALTPDLSPAGLLSAMATDYLADTVLSEAPLLGLLAANGIMQSQKAIEWGAKTAAATVAGRTVSGSLASDANGANQAAALSIPDYYFKHQFDVVKTDLANVISTGKITAVRNPVAMAIADAIREITRKMNQVLYTGNGTSDSTHFGVVGLQNAIGQTGTYAGINRATLSRWRSIVTQGTAPGTPQALTVATINSHLRARRAAGAADMYSKANDLIMITSDEIEKDVLQRVYAANSVQNSVYENLSKTVAPYASWKIRDVPVISDLDHPANAISILNLSKIGLYSFDRRPTADLGNNRVQFIPLRVDSEDTSIQIRLADVSDEHPDVYKLELSASLQLAVWDLKDGISQIQDVSNTLP